MKLLKDISEYFDFLLIDFKFEINRGCAFGSRSGVVEMKGNNLRIKIVSDRNQTYIEVGSIDGKDWCELSVIRYFIDQTPISFMSFVELSSYLKTNLEKIGSIYSVRKNVEKIEELKYKVANNLHQNT